MSQLLYQAGQANLFIVILCDMRSQFLGSIRSKPLKVSLPIFVNSLRSIASNFSLYEICFLLTGPSFSYMNVPYCINNLSIFIMSLLPSCFIRARTSSVNLLEFALSIVEVASKTLLSFKIFLSQDPCCCISERNLAGHHLLCFHTNLGLKSQVSESMESSLPSCCPCFPPLVVTFPYVSSW